MAGRQGQALLALTGIYLREASMGAKGRSGC